MVTTNGEAAWADAAPPSLLDPGAFECPCGPCEYDCQKRAPVRSACACKRLLCRKCAGVAASLPGPVPCGLCGAEAVGPFEAGPAGDVGAEPVRRRCTAAPVVPPRKGFPGASTSRHWRAAVRWR